MFFERSAAKNTGTYHDFSRLQRKNALLLACTEHLKNTAKKHPRRPQFFQNHFKEYRKNLAKYTGAPVQGIKKKTAKKRHEQNRTFRDTPLSPPGSKKHPRRSRFVSNPSQEYLKTLQKSSVAPCTRHLKNIAKMPCGSCTKQHILT